MAFYKTLSCDVPKAYADTFGEDWWDIDGGIPETDECTGPVQVMHLREHASQKRAPDYRTAPGCKHHHQDIDGKVGGRGPWYVALGREGQRALRDRLVARANLRWLMLTGNQRADWDARSRLQPATKTKGPNHA